ncbi:hypothetical protein THAOC_27422, partial [Thalassiosira oceanica]
RGDDVGEPRPTERRRVAKKDPKAINKFLGDQFLFRYLGLQDDMRRAFELFTEAADLGSIGALVSLVSSYHCGEGVKQDMTKAVQFWTKAAMRRYVESSFILL